MKANFRANNVVFYLLQQQVSSYRAMQYTLKLDNGRQTTSSSRPQSRPQSRSPSRPSSRSSNDSIDNRISSEEKRSQLQKIIGDVAMYMLESVNKTVFSKAKMGVAVNLYFEFKLDGKVHDYCESKYGVKDENETLAVGEQIGETTDNDARITRLIKLIGLLKFGQVSSKRVARILKTVDASHGAVSVLEQIIDMPAL